MRKFLIFALSAIMLLAVGCGGQTPSSSSSSKPLVVGLDDNFPPMGFKDENNEIVGFDVDLAKEASKRLNREVQFKAIDWSSKEAELKSGRVDVLWNGLDITEKRKANMQFSEPYMDNRQIIFVRKGEGAGIESEKDLAGKIVGTQSGGGTAEEYIDSNNELRNSFADYKKYPDFIAAFMDLENGRIDAVVADEIIGRYYMSKHDNVFDALDVNVGPVSTFGIGFRKDDTALKEEVQKVLDEMKKDGVTAKISEQWFGKNITK